MITFSEVTKHYAKQPRPILDGISLHVFAGEILGIRGRNGAGKSTLIGLMAGVLQPDAGTITYGDGVKGHIAYVPQELSLYEELTCMQNLVFWGRAAGRSFAESRAQAKELLARFDLSSYEKRMAAELSGGMKRRLHLATALMTDARAYLLDEPTVGADLESKEAILQSLRTLREAGKGVVFVSHLPEETDMLCNRVLTLVDGKLSA